MANNFAKLDTKGLDRAILVDNCTIKVFRSGKSYCLVRVEKNDVLVACGETVNLLTSLQKANDFYVSDKLPKLYFPSLETRFALNALILDGCQILIQKKRNLIRGCVKSWEGNFLFERSTPTLKQLLISLERIAQRHSY